MTFEAWRRQDITKQAEAWYKTLKPGCKWWNKQPVAPATKLPIRTARDGHGMKGI